jgi:hypothetical protein
VLAVDFFTVDTVLLEAERFLASNDDRPNR